MHLFISAGEPSGDLHGSNLIRALRRLDPSLHVAGFGGDKMRAAGCHLLFPLAQIAVMGFIKVFKHLFTFMRLAKMAKRYFEEQKPDALIVIDFGGFHFPLVKRAHAAGIPVYWFIPPQLWGSRSRRIKKMKKYVTHLLCPLAFEEDWYRQRGMPCTFVGHPYFDELTSQKPDAEFVANQRQRPERVIALLPGSRIGEIRKNFRSILLAAEKIHRSHPQTRFLVAAFNEEQAALVRQETAGCSIPLQIHIRRMPEILAVAECAISVSGSVSLELMYRGVPTAIIYRLPWLHLAVSPLVLNCRFITLVNLFLDRELFPEFFTCREPSSAIAKKIGDWLDHPEQLAAIRHELATLKSRVAAPGACERAAEFIAAALGHRVERASAA